jgi:hypothetical protein
VYVTVSLIQLPSSQYFSSIPLPGIFGASPRHSGPAGREACGVAAD